jgi:DNA-binding transcriptional ArsR family regulator
MATERARAIRRRSIGPRPAAVDPVGVEAAVAALPTDETMQRIVEALSAVADPTRLRILYALTSGALCVRDLAMVVDVSESAVSHQLRLLRDRRLVRPHRDGNVIYYALGDRHVAAMFREVVSHANHARQGVYDLTETGE